MIHAKRELTQVRLDFAELTRFVERLALELRHTEKTAEQERKNLLLEIENKLLRTQRRLLPPEPENDDTDER